ncbi:MAG TPA: lysophospholipid acyltransferase family protein [Steroidobacteraceae bacterium]|nr:lysophospholipid acyltransferase family protein [Steroidobacteraceae bacterium]
MSGNRKPIRAFLLRRVFPPIALWIYRRWGGSWRYVIENEEVLTRLLRGPRPVVGAFLHGRTFQLLYYFSRPEHGRWILMCSQSRDGDFMAQVEEGLGFRVARGSSGKGGARALVQMIKGQREDPGLGSCLAIDGSRGPRGIAQFGTLTLAQKTGGVLVPVAASTAEAWICGRCWDRNVMPKPYARIRILIGEPIEVPPGLDASALEATRALLEQRLLAMHAELDARTGFRDSQPLRAPDAGGPPLVPDSPTT